MNIVEFEGEAERLGVAAIADPTDAELASVSGLVAEQLRLDDLKARLEAKLKETNEKLALNREVELPRALMRCGWSPGTKAPLNGALVDFGLKYRCGQLDDLPAKVREDGEEEKRPLAERLAALAWLEENGHADLAKETITVSLGRGQEEMAQEILAFLSQLRSNSMEVRRARVVPWNTLAKFTKEQDEAMAEPPLALLGVSKANVAKVKAP